MLACTRKIALVSHHSAFRRQKTNVSSSGISDLDMDGNKENSQINSFLAGKAINFQNPRLAGTSTV